MGLVWWIVLLSLWLVMLLVSLTYLLPSTVSIKKQVMVDGSPAAVFAQLNQARKWPAWFPWGEAEEGATAYEGPKSGKGATRKWRGSSGTTGHQVIVDVDPPKHLQMSLRIAQYGPGYAEWVIESNGELDSRVTCILQLDLGASFWRRWEGLFLWSQIAEELEEGLRSLKAATESSVSVDPSLGSTKQSA